jgi:hypothetical protein
MGEEKSPVLVGLAVFVLVGMFTLAALSYGTKVISSTLDKHQVYLSALDDKPLAQISSLKINWDDLNDHLLAQIPTIGIDWSSWWCGVKNVFNIACEQVDDDRVTEDKGMETVAVTPRSAGTTSSSTITYVTNEYVERPIEREVVREVVIRNEAIDTSRFVTNDAYQRQVEALLSSIENSSSGSGSSGLSDITSESLEDLSDVDTMTQSAGDFLYWNGSAWSNIATSSLGVSLFTDSGSSTYLTATGDNLGIGTTTPAAKLHVTGTAGALDILAISSSTAERFFTVAATGNVGIGDSSPTALFTVGSGDLFQVSSAGAVSTASTLSVTGTSTLATTTATHLTVSGRASADDFNFSGYGGTLTWANDIGNGYIASDFGIEFNLSSTRPLQIKSGSLLVGYDQTDNTTRGTGNLLVSGDVAIGTSTPAAKLHVTGTAGPSDIFAISSSTGSRFFTVTGNGNIGIGDSSPTALFTVGAGDLFQVSSAGAVSTASTLSVSGTSTLATTTITALTVSQPLTISPVSAVSTIQSGNDNSRLTFITNRTTASDLAYQFQVNGGTQALNIDDNGNVGIGVTAPGHALHVSGNTRITSDLYVGGAADADPANNNTQDTFISGDGYVSANFNGAQSGRFGRSQDGNIVCFYSAGSLEGCVSISGTTVTYGAFTGAHYAITDDTIERGRVVTLTGENGHLGGREEAELLYGIEETTAENDPAVLGSYLALSEPEQLKSLDNPHLVMAVGNGDMWIADNGEDIEIGDYLISSSVTGHAMKDPGTYPISHIFARASEPVDWSEVTATINGVKHKKIIVTFEAFDYANPLSQLSDESEDGFFATLKAKLITWFADATNGIGIMMASIFHASEMICVDNECLTADDIRQLKNNAKIEDVEPNGGNDPEPENDPVDEEGPDKEDESENGESETDTDAANEDDNIGDDDGPVTGEETPGDLEITSQETETPDLTDSDEKSDNTGERSAEESEENEERAEEPEI